MTISYRYCNVKVKCNYLIHNILESELISTLSVIHIVTTLTFICSGHSICQFKNATKHQQALILNISITNYIYKLK